MTQVVAWCSRSVTSSVDQCQLMVYGSISASDCSCKLHVSLSLFSLFSLFSLPPSLPPSLALSLSLFLFAVHVVSVLLQVPGNVSQALGRFSEVIDLAKDWRLLSLSAELLSSLLARSLLFPPSGRLSAELSSSFLACSPYPLRRRR